MADPISIHSTCECCTKKCCERSLTRFLQVPSDVDVRVMLTFLELYQTLLGFVFFKLYTDAGLVYPPPLDTQKDESAAGVGAFSLQDVKNRTTPAKAVKEAEVGGVRVSSKDVRQTIKSITTMAQAETDVDMPLADAAAADGDEDEEFVAHPSISNPEEEAALPTLKTLSTHPQSSSPKLFAPYTFWLSRETSRPIFEFMVRSFGGRIGWPASSGGGSPFDETDSNITHVIIDRPLVEKPNETEDEKERRRRRKHIQPQWVADCINAGKILPEDMYAQGRTLPPHLSPFGERVGAYDPIAESAIDDAEMDGSVDEEEVDAEATEDEGTSKAAASPSLDKAALAAAAAAKDAAALRAAELQAEAAGIDFSTFEKEAQKAQKTAKKTAEPADGEGEQNMNKMMMSNKQKKLYERMKYGEKKRAMEVSHKL